VPLVVAISTTLGARGGLLVRDRRGLEEARNLDTVIFDKTGTLTLGEFRVVRLSVAEGSPEDDLLGIAAGVESESEHPIARGIVKTAEEKGVEIPAAGSFRALTGKGEIFLRLDPLNQGHFSTSPSTPMPYTLGLVKNMFTSAKKGTFAPTMLLLRKSRHTLGKGGFV
jgi:magnesium-transporting ATPase (P-type)